VEKRIFDKSLPSLRPLRISAFSALKGKSNAEDAEIRRER